MYVFHHNLKAIQQHNADPQNTYLQGVNQFTDLTPHEFAALYLTLTIPSSIPRWTAGGSQVKASIDWLAAGKVSAVRDQGQCGTSWTFSASGAIESLYMIEKHHTEFDLSEQEMMDCSHAYGNVGCFGGGLTSNTFRFVSEKGVHEEKDYPYLARDQPCRTVSGSKWFIGSFVGDYSGCDFLMEGLLRGPVSVAVDGTYFQSYKSGIFNNCGQRPNIGSLVVGVTDSYWILKQSWSTKFGEYGFIRIAPGNTCGVCEMGSYPLLLI